MAGALASASIAIKKGLAVSLGTGDVTNIKATPTCTAGIRYDNAGAEWASTNIGSYTTSRGDWLDAGNTSDCFIERTINSGTLSSDNVGSSRVALTTTRTMSVSRSSTGTKTCNITVKVYDAASGGTLLDQVTITLSAQVLT